MSDLSKVPSNAVDSLAEVETLPENVEAENSVDYVALIHFLVEPFLDAPESLRVNCEASHQNSRVLIRLAIEGEDKGKVFGRGGRNIQAVRTVLQAIGQSVQQKVHLEVFGGEHERREGDSPDGAREKPRRSPPKRPQRRPPRPKPNPS